MTERTNVECYPILPTKVVWARMWTLTGATVARDMPEPAVVFGWPAVYPENTFCLSVKAAFGAKVIP
jgi:hypothetical protein